MQKAYSKRNWKNRPNTSTPLGESNLTPMDNAIDEIDNRVVAYDTTKANQSDLLTAFKAVSFNSTTGVFTFTKFNDTTVTVDTDIEKIAVNFDYDDDPTSAHYQNLIITLDDGTVKYVDMSALLTQYEFSDSSTIHFSVTSGVVSANVINGSITADHLAPSVMAGINSAVASAEDSAEDSEAWAVGQRSGTDVPSTDETYHNNSKYYSGLSEDSAEDSEAYAIGTRNGVDVPSTDPAYENNAKYYAEHARDDAHEEATNAEAWAVGQRDGTDVPSTDETYNNNAKYWAGQAQSMSHGVASNISYDNTTSGLIGDDVQEAIDELSSKKTDENPTFTEASTRANIASGESFATILGKIKKFFTDLKTVAFSGLATDVSYDANTTVKDAIDGKVSKSGDTMSGNLSINNENGTASEVGSSWLVIGNNKAEGTAGNSKGAVRIFGKGSYRATLQENANDPLTANRDIYLPNKGGTIALTSDIPPSSYDLESPTDVDAGIRALHKKLSDGETVSAWFAYTAAVTNDIFVSGYRVNYARGRYLCMKRTDDVLVSYRITGSTTMEKTTFSGTTQTISG